MAHLSMQDDVPAPHVYRPFLITLCYNGRQQNLSRPESLSNVRNNATWTFNLPIDTLPDSIAIGYRVGRQTKTVTCEDDWTALRSQRKVKTFTVELVCFSLTY